MARELLIDFDATDLSEVVVPPEEIGKFCQQRGRFALLDGLLRFDLEGEEIVGFKDLTAEDWWAPDHIPGRPLFPGVLMVEGAAQLSTFDFYHRRPDLQGKFVGFAGVDEVRFRGTVEPPARMLWAARPERIRSRMFTYRSQGFVDRQLVFEALIVGAVI